MPQFVARQAPRDTFRTQRRMAYLLAPMSLEEKEKLAHTGDVGQAASAIRLIAARMFANMTQAQFADASGVRRQALSNMELGLSYPNRQVMKYLYRAHRLDFNFLMHGDFAQLPQDVQDRLFATLAAANSAWDQRQRSDRNQSA